MNKVILIGNLTKDPEIRTTNTGKKVASFSLAINEGKSSTGQEIVSYFNCSAWDKKAEVLEMYAKKGHKICVTGRLTINSWQKPDGSKASTPEIVVAEVELLTSRIEAERINSNVSNSSQNGGGSNNGEESGSQNFKSASPKEAKQEQKQPEQIPSIDINNMDFDVQMPF